MPDRPHVRVDPAQRFGWPNIKGISTAAIAGMVMAGEDVTAVADDYSISRHEVLLACWHEGIHGVYRTEWGRWAERIQPRLGGWEPFDPDTEAGPPSRNDVNGG